MRHTGDEVQIVGLQLAARVRNPRAMGESHETLHVVGAQSAMVSFHQVAHETRKRPAMNSFAAVRVVTPQNVACCSKTI